MCAQFGPVVWPLEKKPMPAPMDSHVQDDLEARLPHDSAALDELIGHYWKPIVCHILTFVNTAEEAEDVAQQAFLRVFLCKNRFDVERGTFKSWVYTIATNVAKDYLRMKRGAIVPELDSHEDDTALLSRLRTAELNPEEVLLQVEATEAVRECVDALCRRTTNPKITSCQQRYLFLMFFGGFQQAEVAEICQVKSSSVRNALKLAYHSIKSCLESKGVLSSCGVRHSKRF